jgi:hypothetical protein
MKLPGLPVSTLCSALAPAAAARAQILERMEAALAAYEAQLPPSQRPQSGSVEIDKELVPRLIGLQVGSGRAEGARGRVLGGRRGRVCVSRRWRVMVWMDEALRVWPCTWWAAGRLWA